MTVRGPVEYDSVTANRPLTCENAVPSLKSGKVVDPVLKVSQKLEYAMRAMIELAQRRDDDALVPAREIAGASAGAAAVLGAAARGAVEGRAGRELPRRGRGCRIARDPARSRSREIADAIEGQIYPVFCLEPSDHTCFADSRCGLQGFWADVATAVQAGLRTTRRWRTLRPATGRWLRER